MSVRWVEASNGGVPTGAVVGGTSPNGNQTVLHWFGYEDRPTHRMALVSSGEPIYVARASSPDFNGVVPGALASSSTAVSVPFACKEHNFRNYEVLVSDAPDIFFWEVHSVGRVPPTAVWGGNQSQEPMFIAKTHGNVSAGTNVNGENLPCPEDFSGPLVGKLHPSHKRLYVPFDGGEYWFNTYSVLCAYRMPQLSHITTASVSWIKASDGRIPSAALTAGVSLDGYPMYVGRAHHRHDQLVPGQLTQNERCVRVCWGSREHLYSDYQVLCVDSPDDFEWVWDTQGHVPQNAVIGGEQSGETGFVGRTVTQSDLLVGRTWTNIQISFSKQPSPRTQLVGKVFPSHPCLYVPHHGLEFIYREYEVLVGKYRPKSLQQFCRNAILLATSAIPNRIERLPLPPKLCDYCKPDDRDEYDDTLASSSQMSQLDDMYSSGSGNSTEDEMSDETSEG